MHTIPPTAFSMSSRRPLPLPALDSRGSWAGWKGRMRADSLTANWGRPGRGGPRVPLRRGGLASSRAARTHVTVSATSTMPGAPPAAASDWWPSQAATPQPNRASSELASLELGVGSVHPVTTGQPAAALRRPPDRAAWFGLPPRAGQRLTGLSLRCLSVSSRTGSVGRYVKRRALYGIGP